MNAEPDLNATTAENAGQVVRKPKLSLQESRELKKNDLHRWWCLCDSEKNWVEVGRAREAMNPVWTEELRDSVMYGKTACPYCGGNRWFHVVQFGETSGIYRDDQEECECSKFRFILYILRDFIPERYRNVKLSTLAPSPLSQLGLEKQASEIVFLREHPDDSYFFAGPAGTSKTTMTIALYRHALMEEFNRRWKGATFTMSGKPEAMWRVNGDKLMRQFQEKALNSEAPDPDVTVARIQAAVKKKLRPLLVLEEFDKVKMTEFRADNLFGIVDALYECNGRIILTTNLTLSQFAGMFANAASDNVKVTGTALMRRLTEMCHVRNLFEKGKNNV